MKRLPVYLFAVMMLPTLEVWAQGIYKPKPKPLDSWAFKCPDDETRPSGMTTTYELRAFPRRKVDLTKKRDISGLKVSCVQRRVSIPYCKPPAEFQVVSPRSGGKKRPVCVITETTTNGVKCSPPFTLKVKPGSDYCERFVSVGSGKMRRTAATECVRNPGKNFGKAKKELDKGGKGGTRDRCLFTHTKVLPTKPRCPPRSKLVGLIKNKKCVSTRAVKPELKRKRG